MKKNEKRVIWTDYINTEEWMDDYKEHCEENGIDFDEGGVYAWAYDLNNYYLEDERANLDLPTGGQIIAIADLQLWSGTARGYRLLGYSASDIFRVAEDMNEYGVEGGDVYATCTHHDGTNRIMYRVLRENRNTEKFLDAIYNGEKITRQKLNYYTKSLAPTVCSVYGW